MSDLPPVETGKSICLLAAYFGRLPAYFDCFLRACEFHPSIQWIIVSDDETDWDLPRNVRFHHSTLAELRSTFSRKLGFEVALSHPYRMCDFRPAYGLLFEDLFAGFDFWGHCDLDVVFGDLRGFLTETVLARHDRILQRGHLSIYRNTAEMNGYFMRTSPGALDYRSVFQTEKAHGFDEWRGIYRILRFHGVPQYREEIIADIAGPTRWKKTRFEMTELPNHPWQVFYWYRGKVFQAFLNREEGIEDREVAYIHFQKRSLPKPDFPVRQANGFLITPDGFQPYAREHLTRTDFERFNRERWKPAAEIGADYWARVKRRLLRSR